MEVVIDCYEIKRCGYYRRKSEIPVFGSSEEVVHDIFSWISEDLPTIDATKTFNTHEDSDQLPIYCYNAVKNNNDYLFTMWNETETLDGAFASVRRDQAVGEADIETTEVPANSIPGFPTYFWFVPDKGLLFTIRYNSRVSGIRGLAKYIKGYLELFSKWVVAQGEHRSLETRALGYSPDGNAESIENRTFPDFRAHLVEKEGEVEYIIRNHAQISKIIKKDEFIVARPEQSDRNLIQVMAEKVGLRQARISSTTAKYKLEFDFNPTQQEVRDIINHWGTEETHSKWDDVGFKFRDGTIKWVGHTKLRQSFEINFDILDNNMIESNSLLSGLRAKRNHIFQSFGLSYE